MTLEAVYFCFYLTGAAGGWRPEDHDASKFIKALKGDRLNGYAYVPVCGRTKKLKNYNRDEAIEWFGEMVADYFDENNVSDRVYLVPVPNSNSVSGSNEQPRTASLARAVATHASNCRVADILRFTEEMPSARQGGGTRDPARLYEKLVVVGRVPSSPCILVDDVLTSGGHMVACAARLRARGAEVRMAVCAGRTSQEQRSRAFAVSVEELDEFDPET